MERVAEAVTNRRAAGGLPEPWASMFGRVGKHDGPAGFLSIGAAVNSSDGWSARFDSLTSERHEFRVAVTVSPGRVLPSSTAFPRRVRLEQLCTRLVILDWRAKDDIGNSYVAVGEGYDPAASVSGTELSFLSPIDPRAERSTLSLEASTSGPW